MSFTATNDSRVVPAFDGALHTNDEFGESCTAPGLSTNASLRLEQNTLMGATTNCLLPPEYLTNAALIPGSIAMSISTQPPAPACDTSALAEERNVKLDGIAFVGNTDSFNSPLSYPTPPSESHLPAPTQVAQTVLSWRADRVDKVKRGLDTISVGKATFVRFPMLDCKISKSLFSSKYKVKLVTESNIFEVFESPNMEHCQTIRQLVYDLNSAIYACDWEDMQRILEWIQSGPIFGAESRRKHHEALDAACPLEHQAARNKAKKRVELALANGDTGELLRAMSELNKRFK